MASDLPAVDIEYVAGVDDGADLDGVDGGVADGEIDDVTVVAGSGQRGEGAGGSPRGSVVVGGLPGVVALGGVGVLPVGVRDDNETGYEWGEGGGAYG